VATLVTAWVNKRVGRAMNVVELSYLITPIAGAVGGGTAVKTGGSFSTTCGIATGVFVGVALIAGFRSLIRALPDGSIGRQKRYEWLAVLTMVFLIPLAFPVVTFALSRFIVARVFQL